MLNGHHPSAPLLFAQEVNVFVTRTNDVLELTISQSGRDPITINLQLKNVEELIDCLQRGAMDLHRIARQQGHR